MSCTCLMFKSSPNICSHTVSTAQKVGTLDTFLGWVKRSSKENSLYDISTANYNKLSAGQKGGRQRRVRQTASSTTTSVSGLVTPQEWLLRSSATNSQVQAQTPQLAPLPPSTQRQPWHNNHPFVVVTLSSRIKRCAGCPFDFQDPLGPPFTGIVLQHKEKAYYHDKEGERRVSREANHDYHCKLTCVTGRHPYFTSRAVMIGPETILNPLQQDHLQREFGIFY